MQTAESKARICITTVIASHRVRAKRGPMTGSAKQSSLPPWRDSGLLRRCAPRNDGERALLYPVRPRCSASSFRDTSGRAPMCWMTSAAASAPSSPHCL
ncbi:hypothetical protein AB7M16_003668 [Bradyrhizobium sp. USDA 372]